MKTKIIIITLIFLILLSLIFLLYIFNRPNYEPKKFDEANVINPTLPNNASGINNQNAKYQIIYSDPLNNSKNIELNKKVVIQFNQPIQKTDLDISINRTIDYTQSISNNILTISTVNNYQPGTDYLITLTDKRNNKHIGLIGFITKGSPPDNVIFDRDESNDKLISLDQQKNQYELSYKPDIFLANNSPYKTDSFYITPNYDKSKDKYVFTVKLLKSDKTEAKNDFNIWLKSLGLKYNQIYNLVIDYQE